MDITNKKHVIIFYLVMQWPLVALVTKTIINRNVAFYYKPVKEGQLVTFSTPFVGLPIKPGCLVRGIWRRRRRKPVER